MRVAFRAVVAAAAAFVAGTSLAQEVVRIAYVGPISGSQAHQGKDSQNGARMAIEDLNAKGVTIGGKKIKLELVAEDDAADPRQGTAVAQKLCDLKVNGVVGHLNSGTTIPASRVYNQCGIPMITPAATNPKLTQQGYTNVFRLLANDNALGSGLALYAAKNLKLKRVAIIDDRPAYGQGVAEVFKKIALANGMEVVGEEYTTDKAVDFGAILTAVKAKNPEMIFYGGMDPQAGPMLRQMDQLGMTNVKFFGGDGTCTTKLPEEAANARSTNNVVCAEGGTSLDKMNGGKAWKERYDKKYPGQFQTFSPYTYDALHVLVNAMQKAGSADPKIYLATLASINYEGVTTKVAFAQDGELKDPAMTLYVYKDGKKLPLD